MTLDADANTPAAATRVATSGGATLRDTLADAVGVEIETYLGGATMSIGELKTLESGAVVTLDCALNATVELRVNGLTIAHGELVAVGDRFGVRISTLAP